MRRPSPKVKKSVHGFSLVELSIVMAIVATIATLGLEGAATFLDYSAQEVTKERLKVIDEALIKYRKVNGRLPCPAGRMVPITDGTSQNGYGKEYCNALLNMSSTSLMQGVVPVRDLNLPLEYAIDGYGSKINYVVTSGLTSASTFASTGNGISIRTGKLASDCTSNCQTMGTAAYIIFSPGYDRRGGVSAQGKVNKGCVPSTKDDAKIDSMNCYNIGVVPSGGTNVNISVTGVTPDVFYDSRMSRGFVESNYFDDIVVWHSRDQL